jgi:hypothetical protein
VVPGAKGGAGSPPVARFPALVSFLPAGVDAFVPAGADLVVRGKPGRDDRAAGGGWLGRLATGQRRRGRSSAAR